jgi:nucleotide-binding universal stress UspA family protein
MKVLVPVDGSDCSFRALEFATEFVRRYEGEIHIVHVTDHHGEETERILDRAEAALADAGLVDDPEVVTDLRMSEPRYSNRVGKEILRLVEERDYDHVVMGHHGAGRVGRLILGSAAETVLRATTVPATTVP